MSKVYVEVKVRLVLDVYPGVEVSEVVNELDYSFKSMTDTAMVLDTEILDYNVVDSK
jgi:hypothetical protein